MKKTASRAVTPSYDRAARRRREPVERSGEDRLVSVIVPVVERPDDLPDLYREYSAPLRDQGWTVEFLFVLEPWAAELAGPLQEVKEEGEPIRVLEADRSLGEAGQLKLAEPYCRGEIVLTLPAYHRVEAACLPGLVRRIRESADLAVASRSPRRDAWFNRLQNRIFHFFVKMASGQAFEDVACGVRAMRVELLRQIPLYSYFSRFLPLLAVHEGFQVEEIPCAQHPGDRSARVHSLGTYVRRVVDLFGVYFLLQFTHKPLRFFGLLGGGVSGAGAVVLVVLFVQRITGQGIANRPLLLLGVLLFTVGIQVVALGLVGELIVHLHAPAQRSYRVRERV